MRILFVSASPLKKEISIGNTFLNLFDGEENVEFASIYTRRGNPDIQISKGFCITEKMLINNLLRKTPAGDLVNTQEQVQAPLRHRTQETVLEMVKRSRWTIFFWIQDLVWKLGRWKSPELEKYVKEYDPDILFTVLSNSVCLNNLILHTHALTKAKLVVYAWDNNYSLRQFMISPLRWMKHFIDRASMRRLASKADLLYVISEVQKKDYEKSFCRACKLLTKGADFSEAPALKKECNAPLQLVYTGNIGLNRWKSLKLIANVLEIINKDGIKAQLRIYTATPLTRGMERALNRGASSILMGSVPASEVPGIQAAADILVHVEAMDLKNKLTVRQSFSTKIVDYLKAARPILAVGPKDVASIDHLIRNDCAIVADNGEELERKLREALANPAMLRSVAEKGYECGRKYHNRKDIQSMLINDLNAICGK